MNWTWPDLIYAAGDIPILLIPTIPLVSWQASSRCEWRRGIELGPNVQLVAPSYRRQHIMAFPNRSARHACLGLVACRSFKIDSSIDLLMTREDKGPERALEGRRQKSVVLHSSNTSWIIVLTRLVLRFQPGYAHMPLDSQDLKRVGFSLGANLVTPCLDVLASTAQCTAYTACLMLKCGGVRAARL